MGKIKFGRVLGLAVLGVLSMMAMFAVSAQAAEFQIAGKAALLATATGKQEGSGSLIVEEKNLKLTCAEGDVQAGSEIINSKEGLAKILFLKCTALNFKTNGELPCTVANPEATGIILPVTIGGTPYVLAEQESGAENFTVVKLSGELCPLPPENPVKGTLGAQVTTNQSTIDLITLSKAIQATTADKLTFGVSTAFIEAKATVELTGAHAGLTFGVA